MTNVGWRCDKCGKETGTRYVITINFITNILEKDLCKSCKDEIVKLFP